MTANEISEK
ncbi:unnamed protein product, partial [Rotaria sp. Silwood1]